LAISRRTLRVSSWWCRQCNNSRCGSRYIELLLLDPTPRMQSEAAWRHMSNEPAAAGCLLQHVQLVAPPAAAAAVATQIGAYIPQIITHSTHPPSRLTGSA
jgi:hypothetical protein